MGASAIRAYMVAHPKMSHLSANGAAHLYLKRPEIRAEIRRLRTQAEEVGGSAFLSVSEKRLFLARVIRARIASLPHDSDLWQSMHQTSRGTYFRLPNKIEAIRLDNELSPDETEERSSITQLLISVRK